MLFRMTAVPAVVGVLVTLLEAAYAIGIKHQVPEAGFVIVGSGFSVHYENMIWTNAHVVDGLRELLAEFPDDFSPDAMIAVRNATVIGGPRGPVPNTSSTSLSDAAVAGYCSHTALATAAR